MVIWSAPVPITGTGFFTTPASHIRLNLTSIPDYYSQSAGNPPLYRSLGNITPVATNGRLEPTSIRWPDSEYDVDRNDLTGWDYRLAANVSGNIYEGAEIMSDATIAAAVYRSAALSIADATDTWVDMDAEQFDAWGMHSLTTNPSRVTATAPGWYMVTGGVRWSHNATGYRLSSIWKNRSERVSEHVFIETATNVQPRQVLSGLVWMDVGDYVELDVYQNSGGALDLQLSGPWGNGLKVARLG